jgi:hypothetical protein
MGNLSFSGSNSGTESITTVNNQAKADANSGLAGITTIAPNQVIVTKSSRSQSLNTRLESGDCPNPKVKPKQTKADKKATQQTTLKTGALKLRSSDVKKAAVDKQNYEKKKAERKKFKASVRTAWLRDPTNPVTRDALLRLAKLPSEKANIKKIFALANKPQTPATANRLARYIRKYLDEPRVPFDLAPDQVNPKWLKKSVKIDLKTAVDIDKVSKAYNFRTGNKIKGLTPLPPSQTPRKEKVRPFMLPLHLPLFMAGPGSLAEKIQRALSTTATTDLVKSNLLPGWVELYYCSKTRKVIQINGNNGSATNTDDHAKRQLNNVPAAPDFFIHFSQSVTMPVFTNAATNLWIADYVFNPIAMPIEQHTTRRSKVRASVSVQPGGNYLTGLHIMSYWSASSAPMSPIPGTNDGFYGIGVVATSWANNAIFTTDAEAETDLSLTDAWYLNGSPPQLYLHFRLSATDDLTGEIMMITAFLEAIAKSTQDSTDVYITGVDCAAMPIWTTPVDPCSVTLNERFAATPVPDELPPLTYAPQNSYLISSPTGYTTVLVASGTKVPSVMTLSLAATTTPFQCTLSTFAASVPGPPLEASILWRGWLGAQAGTMQFITPVHFTALWFSVEATAAPITVWISMNPLPITEVVVTNPVVPVGITSSVPLTAGIVGAVNVVGSPATDLLPVAVVGSSLSTFLPSVQANITNILPISTAVVNTVDTMVTNSESDPIPVKNINTPGSPTEVKVINEQVDSIPIRGNPLDGVPVYTVVPPAPPALQAKQSTVDQALLALYKEIFFFPLPETTSLADAKRMTAYIDGCIARASCPPWLRLWSKVKSVVALGDEAALAKCWNALMHALNGNTARLTTAERQYKEIRDWMILQNKYMALAYFDNQFEDEPQLDPVTVETAPKVKPKKKAEALDQDENPKSANQQFKDKKAKVKTQHEDKRAAFLLAHAQDPLWFSCFLLRAGWSATQANTYLTQNKITYPAEFGFLLRVAKALSGSFLMSKDKIALYYIFTADEQNTTFLRDHMNYTLFEEQEPGFLYTEEYFSDCVDGSMLSAKDWNVIMHTLNGNIDGFSEAEAASRNQRMHAANGNTTTFNNSISPVPTPDFAPLSLEAKAVWSMDKDLKVDLNIFRNGLTNFNTTTVGIEATQGDIRVKQIDPTGAVVVNQRVIPAREVFGQSRFDQTPLPSATRLRPIVTATREIQNSASEAYVLTTLGAAVEQNKDRSKPERVVEEGFFTSDLIFYTAASPKRYNWFIYQGFKVALILQSLSPMLARDAVPLRGTLELLDSTWHTPLVPVGPRIALSYNSGVPAFGEDCLVGGNRVTPFHSPPPFRPSVYFLNSLGPIPGDLKRTNTLIVPRAWATLPPRQREQFLRLLIIAFFEGPMSLINWDTQIQGSPIDPIITPFSSQVVTDGINQNIFVVLPMRVGGGLNDTTANQVTNSWLSRPTYLVGGAPVPVPPSFLGNLNLVPLLEFCDMSLDPAGLFAFAPETIVSFLNWFARVVAIPDLPKESIELARYFSYRVNPMAITSMAVPVPDAVFNGFSADVACDIFGFNVPPVLANLPLDVTRVDYLMPTGLLDTYNHLAIGAWALPTSKAVTYASVNTLECTMALLACRRIAMTTQLVYDAIGFCAGSLEDGFSGRLQNNPANAMLSQLFNGLHSDTPLGVGTAPAIWSAMSEKYLKCSLTTFTGTLTIADMRKPGLVAPPLAVAAAGAINTALHLVALYPDFMMNFWTNIDIMDYCQPSPISVGNAFSFPASANWPNGFDATAGTPLTLPSPHDAIELPFPDSYPPIPPAYMRWNARVAKWFYRLVAEGLPNPSSLDYVSVRGAAIAYYTGPLNRTLIAACTPTTFAAGGFNDISFLQNNKLVIVPFSDRPLTSPIGLGAVAVPDATAVVRLGSGESASVSRMLLQNITAPNPTHTIRTASVRNAPITLGTPRPMFRPPDSATPVAAVKSIIEDFSVEPS